MQIIKGQNKTGDRRSWLIQSDTGQTCVKMTYDKKAPLNEIAGRMFVQNPQNYYTVSFISKDIAEKDVVQNFMGLLVEDASQHHHKEVFVYTGKNQKKKLPLLLNAFQQNIDQKNVTVKEVDIMLPSTGKTKAISLSF